MPENPGGRSSTVLTVPGLPRRTAHALFALMVAEQEIKMPPTAREVMVYDTESLSVHSTAAGLRHAQRLGLAATVNGLWVSANAAKEQYGNLEDRVLGEQDA